MNPYRNVPRPRVGRSAFDLSYEKKFTCDMGEIIPSYIETVMPGDIFKIYCNLVIRFQPMLAPLLHEVNAYIHFFFVPLRILWDDWEDFITGGEDGTSSPSMPMWSTGTAYNVGTLWDYLEFPTGIARATGGVPNQMTLRAYNQIWNDYYRDETQQTANNLADTSLLTRNWEKDYFTSALPWQQRGTAPALPISGTIEADPIDRDIEVYNTVDGSGVERDLLQSAAGAINTTAVATGGFLRWADPALEIDLGTATTFDVSDLRLAFQIQKWLERNATGGARYTEFLKSHFGVSPRDDRLDRAEFLGGMKSPVIFSEVLQTSEDGTTPQGNMAGHGISVGQKFIANYRVQEFGIIMGLLSVMPRSSYSQGVNKRFLRDSKYDFSFPEFTHLSEQPITHAEIYTSATPADNTSVFGYQGIFNECRKRENVICGDLRSTFDYWHLGRQFSSKPSLNSTFLQYDNRKDIFASSSDDGLIVSVGNIVKAIRPLPIMAAPGLIDH